jgi:hypothetical protein
MSKPSRSLTVVPYALGSTLGSQTPPRLSTHGTAFRQTLTQPKADSHERALDNFKGNYSSFLAAGGGLSAEAMIFSIICNGESPYERMTKQGQRDYYNRKVANLTFVSPQDQLQDKPDLKESLLNFVALLDVIDIGHDAMMKLDCILNTYVLTQKHTQLLTQVLNKIFTKEGNFRPVVGKEEIIVIIDDMYMLLKGDNISTFERPPSILVVKETVNDVMTKLQAEYNGGRRFVGFPESGRPIEQSDPDNGSIYSSLDGGSGSGHDSPEIKRYCSEYGIVNIYARFIRKSLYEIIQIVEDKDNYHCFVILATNEISLNQVLLAISRYLNKQYESAERGAGVQGLTPTMKLIRYEKKGKSESLDECAETLHLQQQELYQGNYVDIPELWLTPPILKHISNILECCLWALKSMGDKGGTIHFLSKQKGIYQEARLIYDRAVLKQFSTPPVKRKCIMWTVDSFLAAIILGYYYAGLIDEHPIVALSHAKGWDVCIPPNSDSTGYAIALYQLETYNDHTFSFLKKNYGLNHLKYVVEILFPSIRHTHNSFFYRILEALLKNILRYLERKFNDYAAVMEELKQDLLNFEDMSSQDKQAFLLRVPNELSLDFSSIIGKLLLLFFEFSQENQQETAQKIFNQIAASKGLNRFDIILGTKRTMNDSIGSNLDILLSAFKYAPPATEEKTFLDFITLSDVMETEEGISVVEQKKTSLKENMGDEVINQGNIERVLDLLKKRESLYHEEIETLQTKVQTHSHLKESMIVESNTFGVFPRALEVRIETLPDTTFIYVRTNITAGGVGNYNAYLREMTVSADEEPHFSIERIEVAFYIKFPINVQFLADFSEKHSTQPLSLYTMTQGVWIKSQSINVKLFCEREIRNILQQLFPSVVLTDDIDRLLPVPYNMFSRSVESDKRALDMKQSSQKKSKIHQQEEKQPSIQEEKQPSIEEQMKVLTDQLILHKKNKKKTKEIQDKLNLLQAEQQLLLKGPTKKKGKKGGRKTRRIRKKFTLKHKKRSMRKTQRRSKIIK